MSSFKGLDTKAMRFDKPAKKRIQKPSFRDKMMDAVHDAGLDTYQRINIRWHASHMAWLTTSYNYDKAGYKKLKTALSA